MATISSLSLSGNIEIPPIICQIEGEIRDVIRDIELLKAKTHPLFKLGKEKVRAAAALQNSLEESRDAEWSAVGIVGDVRESILARIKENPEESLNLYSNFRPLNVNEIDFQYALIWGQKAELAKRQCEYEERIAEETCQVTVAELEKKLTDNVREIIVFFLNQTPGYDDINAPYSPCVLVPAIRILKVENNIWENGELLCWAEEHWTNNRPCVLLENNRRSQTERNEETVRRESEMYKREMYDREIIIKLRKKELAWAIFKADILPSIVVSILIVLSLLYFATS